jgi:Domain of unknown function (DUF4260)
MTSILIATHRALYAVLALALLGACLSVEGHWWPAVVLGIAPDLALLAGFGRGLAPGQMHPRAVPLYNALHRFPGPVVLGAALVALGLSPLAPLAWALHIAVDRTLGYGLRTRDGFRRA